MSDRLEFLSVYSEENVLDSESIDVARNLSCTTNSLYSCLVASLTELTLEFNVFHCLIKLKCVTQFLPEQKPHCTKKPYAFYGAAKIDKIFESQMFLDKSSEIGSYLTSPVASFQSKVL